MNTNQSNSQSTTESPFPTLSTFEAAFVETAPQRAKLDADDLLQINLEIPSAIATVIGTLPAAKQLRERMTSLFTASELAEIDALETYANALSYAHTAVLAASAPPAPLQHLFERGGELLDLLVSDATALAKREIIDRKVLAQLKGGTGYLNIAYDLGAIVHLMRVNWSAISLRSAVRLDELEEAELMYQRITRAFAERERQSEVATAAANDRSRAYTLLINAYDELRCGAMFVRRKEDDADKLVPSLYAGRGGRPKAEVKPKPTPTPTPTPSAPVTDRNMPGGSPFAHH
jgi:hypothetical protein